MPEAGLQPFSCLDLSPALDTMTVDNRYLSTTFDQTNHYPIVVN